MTASKSPAIFRLRIRHVHSDRNAAIRHLKALLKAMLRQYHYRAVTVEEEQGALTAAHSARFEAGS
jgi:hypothetical protein